jgi:hypothetical protein
MLSCFPAPDLKRLQSQVRARARRVPRILRAMVKRKLALAEKLAVDDVRPPHAMPSVITTAVVDDDDMPCTAAAKVLQEAGLGVRRVPLNELGVSPLNRLISGKHMHQLGRRIVSVEGFARYRYKQGCCHEPDPADPLAVARATNLVASRDPLLAKVGEVPLKGSFMKTHLMSFLQAIASGTVYWDDTKQLMIPPPAMKSLEDHVKHGMFYEVLPWSAVSTHRDAVKCLIASDNFSAGFDLAQTEIDLFKAIHLGTRVSFCWRSLRLVHLWTSFVFPLWTTRGAAN